MTAAHCDPVFSSVGQALHISFLMEILPVTQKVSTQILIDSIKQQLGKVEARVSSTINLGGMSPLEFRGQCAMVRSASQNHLTQPEFDAIRTRFGWQRTQAAGIQGIHDYLLPLVQLQGELALKAILWSLYHRGERKGLAIRDIERETGIPKSTLADASGVVRRSVQGLEERAHARLGDLFERTGLVGYCQQEVA